MNQIKKFINFENTHINPIRKVIDEKSDYCQRVLF